MGLLNKAIITIQRVGLINTIQFVRYAQKRDRLERQAGCSDFETGPPQAPGLLQKTKPIQSGVILAFEHSSLEVRFLAGDLARLSWSPGNEPVPYAIAHKEWPPPPVDLLQEGAGWQIRSDHLTIFVMNDSPSVMVNGG